MVKMVKISVSLPEKLEEKVRNKAIKQFGIKKGYLSKAVIKALETWLEEE
jgi:metal-responsive CopG/Arc/MetJ family transcriptional regulator